MVCIQMCCIFIGWEFETQCKSVWLADEALTEQIEKTHGCLKGDEAAGSGKAY